VILLALTGIPQCTILYHFLSMAIFQALLLLRLPFPCTVCTILLLPVQQQLFVVVVADVDIIVAVVSGVQM